MTIEVKQYSLSEKDVWNEFVTNSKNGTFILYRDYLEYHADRFQDHSLLFYLKGKLIAILPANKKDDRLVSHEGLTYGGLIMSTYTKISHVIEIVEVLKNYLRTNCFQELVYKKIPYIYSGYPADEDIYALFNAGAQQCACSIASCIYPTHNINYSELRRRGISKALKHDLTIRQSNSFSTFWAILETNLATKYKTTPTHSLQEIEYLAELYPNNIILYEVSAQSGLLGGCIIYKTKYVFHIQYIASTKEGQRLGALDFLFDRLITENKDLIFDFGTSTENNGLILNQNLIFQKEGFGARAVTYNTYKLKIE